jgi:hypothetical protein
MADPFDIGGAVLQWIGGTVRFGYGSLIRSLGLTKRPSFTHREYVNGPDAPDDVVFDTIGHRFNNRLLGLLVLGLFLSAAVRGC